jgi:phosphonate degradation associated HDIG domain protein
MQDNQASSPPSSTVLDELGPIYGERAHRRYGLADINQLMHAVQSGALARAQGQTPTQVVAALLHDIGHMVHTLGEHPAATGIDDRHEDMGARWLARHFGAAVTEPVRLHVAAKRYLCATEPGYFASLSSDSVESLALQGGPMTQTETADFERQRYWREAVALRRIDEQAKDPNGPLPPFADFHADITHAQTLSPPTSSR